MIENRKKQAVGIMMGLLFLFLLVATVAENVRIDSAKWERTGAWMKKEVRIDIFRGQFPLLVYVEERPYNGEISLTQTIMNQLPLYAMILEKQSDLYTEDNYMCNQIMEYEGEEEELYLEMELENNEINVVQNAQVVREYAGGGFLCVNHAFFASQFEPALEKGMIYQREDLMDYEYLMENFYIVDSTTSAGIDKINPQVLLNRDVTMEKKEGVPQILIYHTHSQEAFADSIPGDARTSIVGAGAVLSQILEDKYGYCVIHHTGEYDVESRDYAYTNAAPAVEQILQEYPSIEVIIDLHRDAVANERRLVVDLNGVKTAQFMFFNGLSYTNVMGDVDYLANSNREANLAFSLHMQIAANEYYPGLTRKIYLKGYRYNMQYREKSLLIELGAQTNTISEIMNACEPLAHVLDLVLTGKENQ